MHADPRKPLRSLYRGQHSWSIPATEQRRIRSAKSTETYGEIMPTATQRLLEYLELSERDVFYDLGSGMGRLVLHTAAFAPLRRVVGIELSQTRYQTARTILRQARKEGLILARQCSFRCEDFMRARLASPTRPVVYTCSTAFPPQLMRRLARKLRGHPRPLRFVTLQDLDPTRGIELLDVLRLDVTWRRRAKVHVYRVTPR